MSTQDNTTTQVSAWKDLYVNDCKKWEDNPPAEDYVDNLRGFLGCYSVDFHLGDIITLDPSFVRLPHLGSKIVVLQKWTDHSHLIAPLSRLSEPATRGEIWVTGGRVVEVWNAKIVPDLLIEKGWNHSLNSIPQHDQINCRDLFRNLTTNTPFREEFDGQLGPELWDPLDIRNNWQAEEKYQWEPLAARVDDYVSRGPNWDRVIKAAKGHWDLKEYLYSMNLSVLEDLAHSPEVDVLVSYWTQGDEEEIRVTEYAPHDTVERNVFLAGKTVEEIVFHKGGARYRVLAKK